MEEAEIVVEGKRVDQIFFPGEPLLVSLANYRFDNRAPVAKTCTVNSCHFIENEKTTPLDVFHIYAEDRLLDRVVTIPPATKLDVRVTFPFREVRIGVNFSYGVRLNVECDGRQYDVISDLQIIQEKPSE